MYYVILAILTAIVVLIAKKSSMLRNELFNEENFCKLAESQGIKNPRPSYSLGRTQLAFWTVIVMSSFIYVLMELSHLFDEVIPIAIKVPELNNVNLALLGIAAGTTIVSKVIDSGQKETQGAAVPQQDYPSNGFLLDIISDEKGVSIHRLQNVIWTIIVGAIYIAFVSSETELPTETTITTQLFALMGISTGAYLGLKLNENKNAPVSPETVNESPAAVTVDEFTSPPAPQIPMANLRPLADGDEDNQ